MSGGGSAIIVENSLESTSEENALSANQGRLLKAMIDAIPSYEVEKTEGGYKLVTEAGGEALGEVISFSDLVVKSGEVVEEDGLFVIRLTLSNDDTIDIPAASLVEVYTSNDKYINITADNKIGINFDVLKSDLNIPEDLSEQVSNLTAIIGTSENGLVKTIEEHVVKIGTLETAIAGKVDISTFNTLQATVSGNTTNIETLQEAANEIAIKLGTLETKVDVESVSGAIADAIAPFRVKGLSEGDNIVITETAESGVYKIGLSNLTADKVVYAEGVTVKAKLDALNDAIESAVAGGVVGITAGTGISVDTSSSTTMPVVGIKVKKDSAVVADEDGLDII
jgi:hypothetical protein